MTEPTEPGGRRLEVNDPGKMLLLTITLVGGFTSLILAQVKSDSAAQTIGVGIIMAVVGYLTGNGRLARSGKAPQPTLTAPAQELPDDGADDA